MSCIKDNILNVLSKFVLSANPESIFETVERHYNEPFRAYHNLEHIEYCLKKLDEINSLYPDRFDYEALALAIVYHDVIYKAGNPDKSDEWLSVIYYMDNFGKHIKNILLSNRVAFIIRSTEYFTKVEYAGFTLEQFISEAKIEPECNLMREIDFAILGEDEETYLDYSRKIRQENINIPDDIYYPGRLKALEKILELAKFEILPCQDQAHKNIVNEMETIRKIIS